MVHVCCVPGCSSRSNREVNLSYYRLPLLNKKLLKQWIHKIGRSNLPLNRSTRVCSRHFINAKGRKLRKDEVPSEKLPVLSTSVTLRQKRMPPKEREPLLPQRQRGFSDADDVRQEPKVMDKSSNTDLTQRELQELVEKLPVLPVLENNIRTLKEECDHMRFRLANISHDEKMITFYTGFPSFETLKACFEYLGPAVNHLSYKERNETDVSRSGRPHILLPIEEFFLVLVHLRLGLMEQDIAYRFNISQSTMSRIIITWINFMYLQFKELPLWPKKEIVTSYMPQTFKEQ